MTPPSTSRPPTPPPTRMSDSEVTAALSGVPEWSLVGEAIQRTYHFPDFVSAMKFVSGVAAAAESQQHHPDILIRYNKVTLTLATHDAGGITARDFALAKTTDGLVGPTPPAAPKRRSKV